MTDKKQITRRQTEALPATASQFNKTQGIQKHINMFLEETDNQGLE